jgi:hypothetical protein
MVLQERKMSAIMLASIISIRKYLGPINTDDHSSSSSPHTNGMLPGSAEALAQFILHMNELVDSENASDSVLELQFGDILTRSSVDLHDNGYLVVTALFPPSRRFPCIPPPGKRFHEGVNFLWYSDEGRHILVHRIPAVDLPTERSVLDAVLSTSDAAQAIWQSFHR